MIDTDIKNLWSEIYKPDKYKNSEAKDFFEFEFCMLPHKIYDEDNFFKKCEELKHRFDNEAKDSLYLTLDDKNVPIDELAVFID